METEEVTSEAPSETDAEATNGETDTAVATPTPVPSPADGVQTVDNFTIMVATQGNEIFIGVTHLTKSPPGDTLLTKELRI
jgi:hypothetical protein